MQLARAGITCSIKTMEEENMLQGLPSRGQPNSRDCRPPTRRRFTGGLAGIAVLAGLAAALSTAAPARAQCLTGTTTWATAPMTAQTGTFTATFDATPSSANADGLVGLSTNEGSTFAHFAAIVRFNIDGTIDARNGNNYGANRSISYTAGRTYRIRMEVNVPARTYSAYVTPPGQSEQLIGQNLLFRSEHQRATSLNYWGAYAGTGTLNVCYVKEPTPGTGCHEANTTWTATAMGPFDKTFTATFEATPKAAGMDGLIGISQGAGAWFTDFAMLVRFSTANTIDVRNGGTFAARTTVRYSPGVKYRFRIIADVASRKYDVYVQPTGGAEVQLAAGYAFRTEQQGVTRVDNWGSYADMGGMEVCNFVAAAQNAAPSAKATATPASGQVPFTVQFDGSGSTDPDGTITSYTWNFGDGTTGTGAKVSHTYTTVGTYKVILTVTDDKSAQATATVTIVTNPPNQAPKATANATPTTGAAPLTVNFDASASSDPDGTVTAYAWNFGDGTTGSGAKVSHTYTKAGTYSAKLTVTDDKGATSTTTINITVQESTCGTASLVWQSVKMESFTDLMTAEFDVTPGSAALDGLVGLSSQRILGFAELAAAVRFNIDNTIDARNGGAYAAVSAVPYTPGVKYHVRMVVDIPARTYDVFVTPAGGTEKQIAANYSFRTEQMSATSLSEWAGYAGFGTMEVCNFVAKAKVRNKPPVISGTVTPTSGEAPLAVQCNATGTSDPDGKIAGYEWDFGDGSAKVTTITASHTYTKPGSYKVVLKVTDDGGASSTKEFTVTVTSPPGACVSGSAGWQNTPMAAQQGAFTVEFDATPSTANMDGGVILSAGPVADYADSAVAVRFNSAGLIDVRGDNAYSADLNLAYTAGRTYHFRLAVSVPSRSYSVYVTAPGSTEKLIAENYSFRAEQMNVTSLANWAPWTSSATQSVQVCNFKVGPAGAPTLAVSPRVLDFGLSTTNLTFEVWNSGGSTLHYTLSDNVGWLTLSATSGSSAGTRNKITATVNRTGLTPGTYQGTITVTPSTGAAITLSVIMQFANVPQTKLKPIARWDTVPYQRINPSGTLNVGVVAFSKYGIARVRFNIYGQGYTGPSPVDVTEMTLNPQTGVYEYWTPISANKFTSDGVFTVEATVYGNDGGVRDKNTDGGGLGLDPLRLVVNATGKLPQPEAWVSPNGNDSTAVVNDSTRPFRTVGQAIAKIRAYRNSLGLGNNADGGIVRLTPGTHVCSAGGASGPIACDNEWLTITTAAGGTRSNTILTSGGIVATRKIAVRGITLRGSGVMGMSYNDRSQAVVWADDCTLIGAGRGITTAHPLTSEYKNLYYTGCSITEVHQATSGSDLCRGLTITRISDDAFQNVPCIFNCVVDDVDPLSTGAHADAWQHAGGWNDHNVIVYNLRATNLKYQSLFIRSDINSPPDYAQGMAFVNVYMQMRSDSHGWGGWYRWVDHMLWWHCSFTVKGMGIMPDTYAGTKQDCRIRNMSVKGCDFAFLAIGGSDANIDYSDWSHNHFVDPSVTRGTNVTTGANRLDSDGVPQSNSPLVDRMSPVVPVDARNKLRTGLADVGAYER